MSATPPSSSPGSRTLDQADPTTPGYDIYGDQRRIRGRLKDSLGQIQAEHRKGIDPVVFGAAGLVAVALMIWGFVNPDSLGTVSGNMLTWVMDNLGWLFIIAASLYTVFVIVLALSRLGRIRLGRDGEKPQFKTVSWISMMFAAGMGIGLVFYGVGEPLWFYMSPPPGTVDGQTPQAAATAMGTTLFHWTLYPWAMYCIVGLGMAYGTYRLGRSQLFSSMFSSLFGTHFVNGAGGRVINILAILAALFGSACSLGLGAVQIGGGLQSTGIMEQVSTAVLVIVIAVLTCCFVLSAVSGIERGIQWLSNTNMVMALILALIVFVGGPTLFILNVIPTAVGNYIGELPTMASRTAASGDQTMSEWLSSWSIFYWAWWVSWSPFVGMFLARISRGRTVREFIVGVLLVPSVVSLLWFSVFGGGAIGIQERAERAGRTADQLARQTAEGPDINFDTILFSTLETIPMPQVLTIIMLVVTVILIAIFFVTGADSASIVMAGLAQNGAEEPKRWNVIFWGVATGGIAAAMLLAGGSDPSQALQGIQNITIVGSVPFVVIMLVLCVALWKDLSNDPMILRQDLAQQVLVDTVTTSVDHESADASVLQTTSPTTGSGPEMSPRSAEDASPITSRTLGDRRSVPASAPWTGQEGRR